MMRIPKSKLFDRFSQNYGRNDVVITGPRLMNREQFYKAVEEVKKLCRSGK